MDRHETSTRIIAALPEHRRGEELVRELAERLGAFAGAVELPDLVDGWLALWSWVRAGDDTTGLPMLMAGLTGGWKADQIPFVRLALVLDVLRADAQVRAAVRAAFALLAAQADATNLFGSAGLPSERGFLAEAGDRLLARVLPRPRDDADLAHQLRRLFPDREAVAWLQRLPPGLMAELVRLLTEDAVAGTFDHLRRSFADGFRLLAVRLQAQGLGRHLRRRGANVPVEESPFFRLTRLSLALADEWDAGRSGEADAWRMEAAACRGEMARIHQSLGDTGVSVDVVFSLEVLARCLTRMELMVGTMTAGDRQGSAAELRRLLVRLATFSHQDRSMRHLAGTNLRLLHQRIVERSGETGEHYVAVSRSDYWRLWAKAAGGGALTTLTAAAKTGVSALHHALHLAPFATGFLYGLNYAVSFVALQHLNLILATKQPAMTAAHMATVMREGHSEEERDRRIIAMAERICHSQLAAAAANVAVVAVGAFSFDLLWQLGTGRHWLSPAEAQGIYTSISPVNSGTLFYAALTGVILWLSSLVGGWADNWSAWHRLPQGIADHPLGLRLGRDRMLRWGDSWRRNIAGWATNISLGFMLGFTPALGEALGIPLDVRHVTLNTGILSLACAGLAEKWWGGGFFLLALSGIAVMFVLNLGVSFALSLYTAMRSFEVGGREMLTLAGRLFAHLLRHPLRFLLPIGLPARSAGHGH